MKKIVTLLLFIVFANIAKATITYTLVTPPCDTNGVLVIQYTGFMLPPYNVTWNYGVHSINHTHVMGFTDTIFHYDGSPITHVTLVDSAMTGLDSASYIGTLPLTYSLSAINAMCPHLGTVSAVVTMSTGPFTIKWIDMATSAVIATGISAHVPTGTYGVWITNSTGCGSGTANTGIAIDVIDSVSFTDSMLTMDANCTNGMAKVGGVVGPHALPLSYLWSNGSTADSITGLSTGYYNVTVTDGLGCSSTSTVFINQLTSITAYISPSNATCHENDGAIMGYGTGGMPPYTYLWSNGATTQTQTGLYAGTYSLTVTDANGCIGYGSGTVLASTPITVTYVAAPSLCTSPTGSVSLVVSGGTTPYHDTLFTTPIHIGAIATGLTAGTYLFRITDAAGCIQSGSVVVPPIDNLVLDFTSTPATCTLSNGSMNVSVTGGVGPLTYLWSTGSTSSSITSQPTGFYHVTVTDGNGCSKTKESEILDYSPLILSSSSSPATCIFTNNGSASVSAFSGTAPYTYSWSNGSTTSTITGLRTGPYWVYVTDHAGCTAYDYNYVGYITADSSCYCTIKGTVYHDANSNCTIDSGEYGIPNIQINCYGFGYTYTDDSGRYSFIVPTGTYSVTETVQTYYPLSGCQPNNIPVTVTATSGCADTINFANIYDTLHDMQISTWDYNHPIPGNSYTQISIIHNSGSITETVPVAAYKADGQIFAPSFVPFGVFGAGTTYDYSTVSGSGLTTMSPGTSQTLLMDYNVPTYIPLGTVLNFYDTTSYTAPMSDWITDYTPWNNVNYFFTPVVASYDPNFKEVSPKGYGPAGTISYSDSVLQYMVHFQNTGTSAANNVVVIDTLDANLDWTTLQPIYQSASCKITQNTSGQIVKFTFNNINLPNEATNPVASNGVLTYSIKTRHGLSIGTQIKNAASIYFDYNTPIKTKSTLNTIGWTIGTKNIDNNANLFEVYPNPAQGSFTAFIKNGSTISATQIIVSDIAGKTLISKSINVATGQETVKVDISKLSAGIYLVTLVQDGNTQTKKLAVIK